VLESRIVSGVRIDDLTPARVEAELRALLAQGVRLSIAGSGRRAPRRFLALYPPRHKLRLFDATFYLAELRQEPNARFFVSYVRLGPRARHVYPRFFYKDGSLIWRSASHFARSESENWIGKGDLKWVEEPDGSRGLYTAEETTNLPLEIQGPLDALSRAVQRPREDERAMGRVLRRAPDKRVAPYADFVAPRRRAAGDRRNLVNGGKSVAWFARRGDPASLRFARGFAPDFHDGVIEESESSSRLYAGRIRKFRVLSENRRIQWQFCAAPRLAWIVPPQTLTTELSSYGVRTLDVEAADDLCVPGMEYHYLDDWEDPPALYSQIPPGFAGPQSEVDVARADASPWLERLPVIAEFRRALHIPRPGRLPKRGGSP
jgi:hypothetical protein